MDGWMDLCICVFMYVRSLEAGKLSQDVTGECESIFDCDGVEIWQSGRGIDEQFTRDKSRAGGSRRSKPRDV